MKTSASSFQINRIKGETAQRAGVSNKHVRCIGKVPDVVTLEISFILSFHCR